MIKTLSKLMGKKKEVIKVSLEYSTESTDPTLPLIFLVPGKGSYEIEGKVYEDLNAKDFLEFDRRTRKLVRYNGVLVQ